MAEADLLSVYTKEGSQQPEPRVEQRPLGLRGGVSGSEVSTEEDQEIRKSSISLQREEDGAPRGFVSAVKSPREELIHCCERTLTAAMRVENDPLTNVVLSHTSERPATLMEGSRREKQADTRRKRSPTAVGTMLA